MKKSTAPWKKGFLKNSVDEPVHTILWRCTAVHSGDSGNRIVHLAWSKLTNVINQKVGRVYAKRSRAEVADKLQLGGSAATDGIRTASIHLLEKVTDEPFIPEAPDDLV